MERDRQYPYDDPEFLQNYNDLDEESGQLVTSTARNRAGKRKAEALEAQNRSTMPVTLFPSYIPPRSEAEILQRQKRIDTALEVAKKALTAKTLLCQHKITESLKFANQALKIDPNFLLALKCKAEALRCLEKFAKSLKFANRILFFVPDDVNGVNCKFHASKSLANYSLT